ncbi:hypothetical protein SLE2022_283430 [Rubroshorea leprosula]
MSKFPAKRFQPESDSVDSASDQPLKEGSLTDTNYQKLNGRASRSSERRKVSSSTESPAMPSCGPENSVSPAESRSRRRVVVPVENWLPPGWVVEDRVRISGATAGTVDKYYFDPTSGRRFRSKKEVLKFLGTGNSTNKKKGLENSDAGKNSPPESSASKKRMKDPDSTAKTSNFDFYNVPEKISWVLTDASRDCWIPFIGDEKVAESDTQEWPAAFTHLTVGNIGQPTH